MRLLLIILLFPFFLQGQTVSRKFHGSFNIASSSRVGVTNKFLFTGFFNNTNAQYSASQVAVGYKIFLLSGTKYYKLHIDSILSVSANLISCRVIDSTSTLTIIPPVNSVIYRYTSVRRLGIAADGAPNATNLAILNDAIIRLDSLSTASSTSANYNGNRTITGSLLNGQNMGTTTTVQDFLDQVFFPSSPITLGLTTTYGGTTAQTITTELMSGSGAVSLVLNWSAFRPTNATAVASFTVNGVNTSTNPAAGATATGTQNTTTTRNVDATFSSLCTTADGKGSGASTSLLWRAKKYWGYNIGTPTSAQIISTTGGSSEFSTVAAKGGFSVSIGVGTPSNVYYAYPTSFGVLTSIIVSGLESIGAFTRSTVSVTNASGYVQNYYVYTSNNTFSNTAFIFTSVN